MSDVRFHAIEIKGSTAVMEAKNPLTEYARYGSLMYQLSHQDGGARAA